MLNISSHYLTNCCAGKELYNSPFHVNKNFYITTLALQILGTVGLTLGAYFLGGIMPAAITAGGVFLSAELIAIARRSLPLRPPQTQRSTELNKRTIEDLRDVFVHEMRHLSFKDLYQLSQVSKNFAEYVDKRFLEYAKECGYKGEDAREAKKYLASLLRGIVRLYNKDFLHSKYVIFYKNRWGLSYPDREETLQYLRSLISLYPDEKFYLHTQLAQALPYFAEKGDADAVLALLVLGVDPNLRNSEMKTSLHLAVEKGDASVVKILLEKGADPNSIAPSGFSPLCLNTSNPTITNLLLEHGAQLDYRVPSTGLTALDYAKSKKQLKTKKILEEFIYKVKF